MKIALVTQYFWPESFSINDLVKELVNQGHTVDIYTGKPNYPDGEIYSGYDKNGFLVEEFIPGATIYRIPLRPRGKNSAKMLALNYLSFLINGLLHFRKLSKDKDYDLVFFNGLSPITSALTAIYLKHRHNIPMVMWVLDLWPDSLKTTGYVKNKFILKFIGFIVKWIYSKTDKILAQSNSFITEISKYTSKDKIEYFPNFSFDLPNKLNDNTTVPSDIIDILENNFCAVFTGNLGTAQAVETLVEAAESLQDIKDFRLVLVGSGSMSSWIEMEIKSRSLSNIILAGRYTSDEMPQFLNRAKVLIVSLKNEETYAKTVPAKVQTYLAAGKPIIASLNGEGADIINSANAGLTCPAEDPIELAKCIRKLYSSDKDILDNYGNNGRKYFLNNFELTNQAKYLVSILNTLIKNK